MTGKFLVSMVESRIIQTRGNNSSLCIVRDKQPWHTAIEFQHIDMRLRPAFLIHVQECLYKRIGTVPDRGDKEIHLFLCGSFVIQESDRITYPVYKDLPSGNAFLGEDDLYAGRLHPVVITSAELAVAQSVRMLL